MDSVDSCRIAVDDDSVDTIDGSINIEQVGLDDLRQRGFILRQLVEPCRLKASRQDSVAELTLLRRAFVDFGRSTCISMTAGVLLVERNNRRASKILTATSSR